MKTIQKLLLAAGVLTLLLLPVQAEDAVPEPVQEMEMTGETLAADYQTWNTIQWKFDSAAGTLYIGGEGALPQGGPSFYPWYSYASQIKKVVVEEGITDLAYSSVRADTISYTEIHLPSTLTEMDAVLLHGYNLKTITVADGGMFYVQNGILFKDDGTDVTLVCQPGGLVLRTYTVPENVTKIGDYAFMSQTLTGLTLPEGLVSIGSQAFYGCNALTTLHIPAAVTDIHAEAFTYSNVLETITVDPENPAYTAKDGVLFSKDMKVLHTYPARKAGTAYTVPEGVEQIATTVMTHSRILEELTLPASVKETVQVMGSLSPLAFRAVYVDADNPYLSSEDGILYDKDKTTLLQYPIGHTATEYRMPDTVTTIVSNAIWAVSNLNTVYWGSGVETIESRISWGNGVKNMYFPGDVPAWITNGCRNIKNQATLYYPAGNTTWTDGSMTVDGNTYTTAAYEAEEDTVQWNTWENIRWRFEKETGTLTIGGEGEIPYMKSAAAYPWYTYAKAVCELVVEEGITNIPQFLCPQQDGYINMTKVTLPKSMNYVDAWNFRLNPITEYVVAEGGVYYAEDGVLFRSSGDTCILVSYPAGREDTVYTVPEGVTELGNNSVWSPYLMTLQIADTVQYIGYRAIQNDCMTSLHIPAGVKSINNEPWLLPLLEEITVDAQNDAYTAVDGVLFTKDMLTMLDYPENHQAVEYSIPEGVQSIGDKLLRCNWNLHTLHIPASLQYIVSNGSFRSSVPLSVITVDPDNLYFTAEDNVLFNKDMTTLVHYPYAKKDTEYRIPDSVTLVDDLALMTQAHLNTLYLGQNTTFTRALFDNMPNLTAVCFPGDFSVSLISVFERMHDQVILYYPEDNSTWPAEGAEVYGVYYQVAPYNPDEEEVWNTWENIEWKYESVRSRLTIRGEGAVPEREDYSYPWEDCRYTVRHLVVESGITEILMYAIDDMYNLQSVSLPATLKEMNTVALCYMSDLTTITVEEGGDYYTIDNVLFRDAGEYPELLVYPKGLTAVSYRVPDGVKAIRRGAVSNPALAELILPDSLEYIDEWAIELLAIRTLHIPANVQYIDPEGIDLYYLQEITVDPDNRWYTAVDGILYDKDVAVMVVYPSNHAEEELYIPDTVEEISNAMHTISTNLRKLHIPASVHTIRSYFSLRSDSRLEEITVDEDNPYLEVVDGVLYNEDMTYLYCFPPERADAEFRIPDTVTDMEWSAMNGLKCLETLYIGQGIAQKDNLALHIHESSPLSAIYFPGDLPESFRGMLDNFAYSGRLDIVTFYFPEGAAGWETPDMTIDGITFHTAPYVPEGENEDESSKGDITGDGTTNKNDLSLLTQYFSGYPTEIDESAVDLDGNGKLTRKDVMILARYLAGWDGYDQYFR